MSVAIVLFDLDGTLIDSAPGIYRCLSETFAHFGLPPLTTATFQPLVGPPFATSLPALIGDRDLDEVIAHYRRCYAGGGMFEATLYPGIAALVGTLRDDGVRLAVATSKLEGYVDPILRRLGIVECFEVLCGHVEPDRLTKTAVVAEALRRLGHPGPETVLMVGDRLHDVIGAQANGVATLGAGWGYAADGELTAAGAVAVVAGPSGVADYVGGGMTGITADVDRSDPGNRAWVSQAVRKVEADANRSADTHLLTLDLPASWGVDLYLKDESTHPTGSLKHRLARSLVLYGLCNGWIGPSTTLVEASSGSTAISEAYFARMLRLPFVAVMPATTSREKIALIEREGGRCHLVDDPRTIYTEAQRLAEESGGHYLDQFTYAERATDWRGNNNIAESIFDQVRSERHPVPRWIVVGAGTGGTSATIGRFVRYRCLDTGVCVADPENSAFFDGWDQGDQSVVTGIGSRIEGIGRPRVEPSFVSGVVDRMVRVPDAASIATTRFLAERTGRRAGGSTGTNLWAALHLAREMHAAGEPGSIVTLLCDRGDRYEHSVYSDEWVAAHGMDLTPHQALLTDWLPG